MGSREWGGIEGLTGPLFYFSLGLFCIKIRAPMWVLLLVFLWSGPTGFKLNLLFHEVLYTNVFHVVLVVRNLPASAGDVRDLGLIPGSGRFPGMATHSSILA